MMNTMDFVHALSEELLRNANPAIAAEQKAYMRDQFEFFGIKAQQRRDIQKPFLVKAYLPAKEELPELIKTFWTKPQREFHLFAQELVFKYIKQFEKEDMPLLEYMVTHKSWWDTVDNIAVHLMGNYFQKFPEDRKIYVDKWLQSDHLWLQRCAILFQLKYKTAIDTKLLTHVIHSLLGSNEFFINKAIGWVLREYSKTDPVWVENFANQTDLHSLSRKEALRILKKKSS
jgi:3-methyladenine DNA glycosylase AlkD